MSVARPLRVPRPLSVAVTALVLGPLLVALPGTAAAEETPSPGDTVVGELVRAFVDHPTSPADVAAGEHDDGAAGISWVRGDDGASVRVSTEDVEDVEVGSTVEVALGGKAEEAVDGATELEPALQVTSLEVLAAPDAPATAPVTAPVNHPVTVVMLQPAGVTRDATTPTQVASVVDTTVADFWERQTGGAVRFGVAATVDWGAPATVGCDQPDELLEQAAARAGWTWTDAAHLLVYVPEDAPGCADGLGTIGWDVGVGGLAYVRSTLPSLVGHEFGHNLGLGHSGSLQCDSAVEEEGCQVDVHGDLYDVMGLSWDEIGTLNLRHAETLGVLWQQEKLIVTPWAPDPVDVALAPVSVARPHGVLRAVELADVDGTRYWLEYRQASGQDTWLGDPARNVFELEEGVTLRRSDDDGWGSLLLDGTPSAPDAWAGDRSTALPVGTPVPVAGGRFTVTVQNATATDAVVRITATSPIALYHASRGGDAGTLGPPATPVACETSGRCSATYRNGLVTWSLSTGAVAVLEPERSAWRATGGSYGPLRWPTHDRACGLRDGGCHQAYQEGGIATGPGTGARAVSGLAYSNWLWTGREGGRLGYPVADWVCGLRDGGCVQHFQGGSIYRDGWGGVHVVDGAILDRWSALGRERGYFAYPLANARCGLRGGGCVQEFRGGSIYWTPVTGAQAVDGAIRATWGSMGHEDGRYGYPVAGARCGLRGGGCLQQFQGGHVYWSPSTWAAAVDGAIFATWGSMGYENGRYGYPVSNARCGLRGGGCVQEFQGGSIFWNPVTGAQAVDGAILGRWGSAGRENGHLGYPVAGARCGLRAGGCLQLFQGGSIYWTWETGARVVDGAIRDRWASVGWEIGHYGYPQADARCGLRGGGCLQQFQGGSVYWSPATGAQAIDGAIRYRWGELGFENGRLGYPVASAVRLPNGDATQRFQGGSMLWSARTGQVRVS